MEENQNWYEAQGVDSAFVSDKVKGFTNQDGSLNINELLKSYDSSQRYIGGAVKIPQEGASAEEVSAFYSKLGRPESADKYTFKPPADVNIDGVTSQHFKSFASKAFELGLTDRQLSGVMEGWTKIVDQLTEDSARARSEIAENSKKVLSAPDEWGDRFDGKYKATISLIEKLGVKPHLEAAGILNSVEVLKAFNSIVEGGRETALKGNAAGGDTLGRIAALKSSPAYLNANHPDHAAVVNELNSLLDAKN